MSTIDDEHLLGALSKAKNIGLVEEPFQISGCAVVLRNLKPDEYAAVIKDCEGLPNLDYMMAYQRGQVSRAIVEINGVNLREVKFIETKEPDRKNPGQTRTVKLETHTYLAQQVLDTWGKEAISIAYRKFGDVVERAEREAKEGITFIVPEETSEDRYRRLLLEAKECEDDLPDSLIDKILEDIGMMRKTTAEEIKSAMEKTDKLAREQAQASHAEGGPEESPPTSAALAAPEPPAPPVRQPMNRAPGQIPVDPHQTLQQVIAARHQPAPTPQKATASDTPSQSRASAIAALENDAGAIGVDPVSVLPGANGQPIPVASRERSVEVVEIRDQKSDPQAVKQILDRPPVAGLNPRFRPPDR